MWVYVLGFVNSSCVSIEMSVCNHAYKINKIKNKIKKL